VRERGSATVIHLALVASLLVIGLALGAATARVAVRSHTAAVADLAALAAASAACDGAAEVIGRNDRFGAHLTRCEAGGGFAQVEVASGAPWGVRATSLAGPAW